MNGGSVGAVTGARIAYDIHNPSSNQENQGPRKANTGNVQQRNSNNVRSPLSNLPAGRAESGEYGQVPQTRSQDQVEDMVASRDFIKKELEVENLRNLSARKGSNGNLSTAESDDIPENMYRPEKEDTEGWIHREKLAKIENEELQAAGINLAKARSRSKDALGERLRTASRDRLRNDFVASDGNSREEKRRKVSSPLPMTKSMQKDEDEDTLERSNWDLRTPDEIAEAANSQSYSTPVLRKSGSKIPILSPSANATPQEGSERETPVSRKRTMSGSISNEDGLHSPKVRSSSSRWAEDVDGAAVVTSPKTGSPTKVRQKSISGGPGMSSQQKTTLPRKSSTAKSNSTAANGRPRTRGNDAERPRTAVNPPEGDPPWLADMYKPDPRLPPDQQLIPTLAKKQRQMQWEESGMIPKIYDKDFAALAVHENSEPSKLQTSEVEGSAEKAGDTESWPLKPVSSAQSAKEANAKQNVTSSPPITGGYSTMPKVSSPPISMTSPKIGSPPNTNIGAPSPNIGSSRQASTTQQQKIKPQRLPIDTKDEKVQKKGCGCCVVM